MMKNLVIIGARGFGREKCNGMRLEEDYGNNFIIKGFLDDKTDALDGFAGYPPIIDSVEDYQIDDNDVFICALGDSFYRKKYVDIIKDKGGKFLTLISQKSIIHPDAHIGEGVMIGPFSTISSNVTIGAFTSIQGYCTIGHDTIIGDNCSVESYSFFGGGSKIGNNVTFHTRATILPHINVGDNSIVGAGSVVIKHIEDGITVFGVPAKKIIF